jgi:DNA-binding CsgD family transcriptional regulator
MGKYDTKNMDKVLYNRIVIHAKDIESNKPLPRFCRPWQCDGLETARQIYEHIKLSNGETAEEIAVAFEISTEYAKQTILALQNGGADIKVIAEDSGKQHRHKHRYFIEG